MPVNQEPPKEVDLNGVPQASFVHTFFCDNPDCLRVHVALFDEHDRPFAHFVLPDARPDGSGFLKSLNDAAYKSIMLRGD